MNTRAAWIKHKVKSKKVYSTFLDFTLSTFFFLSSAKYLTYLYCDRLPWQYQQRLHEATEQNSAFCFEKNQTKEQLLVG